MKPRQGIPVVAKHNPPNSVTGSHWDARKKTEAAKAISWDMPNKSGWIGYADLVRIAWV